MPLLRFGKHHYFNNYIIGCEDGINMRKDSNAYIENCYFEDTKTPVFGKSSENGRATLVGNIFKNCNNLPPECVNIDGAKQSTLKSDLQFAETDFVPSQYYDYSSVLNNTEDIPTIVPAYAGIGKIDTSSAINQTKAESATLRTYSSNGMMHIVGCIEGSNISLYSSDGQLMATCQAKGYNTTINCKLQHGTYIVRVATPQGTTLSKKVKL